MSEEDRMPGEIHIDAPPMMRKPEPEYFQHRADGHAAACTDFANHATHVGKLIMNMKPDNPQYDYFAMMAGALSNVALANAEAYKVMRQIAVDLSYEEKGGDEQT